MKTGKSEVSEDGRRWTEDSRWKAVAVEASNAKQSKAGKI